MTFCNVRTAVVVLCILCLLCSGGAFANVSLKNGNFYVVYTDIVYPGGFEPKVERVYNSKSSFKGIFGQGWGNDYEVFLTPQADGSVVIHEYGGGADNNFTAPQSQGHLMDRVVESIVQASKTLRGIASISAERDLRLKLKRDARFRSQQWDRFQSDGLLDGTDMPVGSALESNRFDHQVLTRVAEGYIRQFDTGRTEYFSNDGRQIQVSDPNSNAIILRYFSGRISELTDNFGRSIAFAFNEKGLVEQIQGYDGRTATFRYNERDELVESTDVDMNRYTYTYSDDGLHNLTRISYDDGTTMEMSYYGREKHDSIQSVKERDATLKTYAYDFDPKDPNHYKITVITTLSNQANHSTTSYEYFLRRMITNIDGDITEENYNDKGLIETISHGSEMTRFKYDESGHCTYKETPKEIKVLEYDLAVGKVSYVKQQSKTGKETVWSRFRYDNRGNLVYAENYEHKTATLTYGATGRIDELVGGDKTRIQFLYNENSKPVEIRRIRPDGTSDSITVTYTEFGAIKKVDSSSGRKVAAAVTASFEDLLDIIRPAGVTLGF